MPDTIGQGFADGRRARRVGPFFQQRRKRSRLDKKLRQRIILRLLFGEEGRQCRKLPPDIDDGLPDRSEFAPQRIEGRNAIRHVRDNRPARTTEKGTVHSIAPRPDGRVTHGWA